MTKTPEVTGSAAPSSGGDHDGDATWWRQAVIYQIYPRSFADANGDGIGDLVGITSRVPYLRDLGVDAIWISPFYPSALADGGYDVDDYRDVDPRIGTLAQFDALSLAVHDAGMKLMVDIVPNHTSNRHPWFAEALAAGRGSAARERYHFLEGLGEDGSEPPSDWVANFGGSMWTRVEDGQWYLHLFAPEQPDLNWDHPEVRADFLKTLAFWADRGVDGFRIDVAHALVKDLSLPLPSYPTGRANVPLDGSHRFWDRDGVHEIYQQWRALFNQYDPPRMAVAEAWVPAERRSRYASTTELGQAFNFDLLEAQWDAQDFRRIITKNLAEAKSLNNSCTWVFSNHDVVRHASRYGLPNGTHLARWLMSDGLEPRADGIQGVRRARAATLMALALPGSTYLYQGEELGLPEVSDIAHEDLQDPTWIRTNHQWKGRDGCRVPIPWTADGPSFGFGSGGAHLPQPDWYGDYAVALQEEDSASPLAFYREALKVRRDWQHESDLDWIESPEADVVAFSRGRGWVCVTNFSTHSVDLSEGKVLISSGPLDGGRLPGETTVWLHLA